MKEITILLLSCALATFSPDCPDYELNGPCIDFCLENRTGCKDQCFDDYFCESECDLDFGVCINTCPCEAWCLQGCQGCPSAYCKCGDPETNPDYIECKAFFDRQYELCILSCPNGDFECLSGCAREYNDNLQQCPCQAGCPGGCPCEVYVCPTISSTTRTTLTTTTASTTTTTSVINNRDILILNTYCPSCSRKAPVVTNASGKDDREVNFVIDDDVEVNGSCSLTWRGEHFVFGGLYKKNQIAKIIGCELKSVGELPNRHDVGGCANMADNRVYLCFSSYYSSEHKKCRVATSPLGQFVETTQSYESHTYTRIAASDTEILAVGDRYGHKKAEIFNGNNNSWSRIDDYSFADKWIAYAPIVFISDSFYVIGGWVDYNNSKAIGLFDASRRIWSKSGELMNGREGHNAIYDGSSLIVVGGKQASLYDTYKTERCEISNGQVTCTAQTPELNNYADYPELFLVPVNFCKTLL